MKKPKQDFSIVVRDCFFDCEDADTTLFALPSITTHQPLVKKTSRTVGALVLNLKRQKQKKALLPELATHFLQNQFECAAVRNQHSYISTILSVSSLLKPWQKRQNTINGAYS